MKNMRFPEKRVYVNQVEHVESYLGGDFLTDKRLSSIRLDENDSEGVAELLEKIPDGYDPARLKEFYEETGLRIRVDVYRDNYEIVMYDKDGRYPKEDAAVWNRNFIQHFDEHPEWLEPQEDADILVQYVWPEYLETIKRDAEEAAKENETSDCYYDWVKEWDEQMLREIGDGDEQLLEIFEAYYGENPEPMEQFRDEIFGVMEEERRKSFYQGMRYGKLQ